MPGVIRYPDAPRSTTVEEGEEFARLVDRLIKEQIGIDIGYRNDGWYQLNVGESERGVEIKLDKTSSKTHKVAIEVAERSSVSVPEWTPSGIYRRDNTRWYVIGHPKLIRVFTIEALRNADPGPSGYGEPLPTLRRFLLPAKVANALCKGIFVDGKYMKQWQLRWRREYAYRCAELYGDEIVVWLK